MSGGFPVIPKRIDRRSLLGKPKLRSKAHRDWVRSHQCCVPGCEAMPIEVAHVNSAATRGMGMKASDAFTISLCRAHHQESHHGEKRFEARYGIDLRALAIAFFDRSPHRRKLTSSR
jgi:hypothetical protein